MKDHEYLEEELADFNTEKLIVKEKLELVEEQPAIHWWARKFEPIELTSVDFKENIPSIAKPPKLELKQLPSHLKYAYLGKEDTLPIIISSYLTQTQEENLIETLKKHKKATGWQMAYSKGISPTICMHEILLEENPKNSIKG